MVHSKLTDEEFNTLTKLTRQLKFDNSWDFVGGNKKDYVKDYEDNSLYTIEQGLNWAYEGIAYPLSHDNMTEKEIEIIINLFKKYNIGNNEYYNWLKQ